VAAGPVVSAAFALCGRGHCVARAVQSRLTQAYRGLGLLNGHGPSEAVSLHQGQDPRELTLNADRSSSSPTASVDES
jgi:hypothetical protein